MFNLLCKNKLIAAASNARVLGCTGFVEYISLNASLNGTRFYSSKNRSKSVKSPSDPQPSLTVSYLINACGLSPLAAAVTSEKITLKDPEKSDLLLALLGNHGFTNADITRLVRKDPHVLSAPAETILPKLEFLESIGMPALLLAKLTCSSPAILSCSLEHRLVPFYNYLKGLVQTDEKVIRFFMRSRGHFTPSLLTRVPSNINMLRKYGMTESNISFLVAHGAGPLTMRRDKLANLVNKLIQLDIDISKLVFVEGIRVLHRFSESGFEHKKEIYRRWGWSEPDIRKAFSYSPICMSLSEKKITSTMEFLVNEMKCQPDTIARCPILLYYSLEKRIKPRCRVVRVLMMEGLVKKSYSLASLIVFSNKNFLERYVMKNQEKIPQLLDVYHGKVGLVDSGFDPSRLAEVKVL